MIKLAFLYAKTKTQISFAVTAKLISVFVFATRIVQSLFFLNPKFQASSHLLIIIIIIIMTLFQEDNIFGRVASLTYGPQLTNVGMIL